jgi:hypothetical protein
MEDNDERDNNSESPREGSGKPVKANTSKENTKTKAQTKASGQSSKQSERKSYWNSLARGWRASGPTKKLEIAFAGIIAFGGLGYLIAIHNHESLSSQDSAH